MKVKYAICECGWERQQTGFITWKDWVICPECGKRIRTNIIYQ